MPRYLDTANSFNPQAPGTEGLVAWLVGLPPRDGGGTLYDETGLTAGGSLVNGPLWVPDGNGFAGLSFNGTTQHAGGTIPACNLPITLACWVRVDNAPAVGSRVLTFNPAGSVSHVEGLYFGDGGSIFGQSYDGSNRTAGGPALSLRRWYWVAMVATATNMTLYVDGVAVGASTAAISGAALTGYQLGRNDWAPGEYCECIVAGPTLWSRALDDSQVSSAYLRSLASITDHPWLNTSRTVVLLGSAPAGVTGTASGSISLTGVAAGSALVSGVGAGTIPLTGASTGAVAVSGAASGSLPLTGSAVAASGATGVASGTIGFTGSATAAVQIQGSASGAIPLSGSSTGAVAIAGIAAGTLPLTGSASSGTSTTGTGAGSLGLTGSSSGAVLVSGLAVGVLPLAGSVSATVRVSGLAAGSIPLTGLGSGIAAIVGLALGSLPLTGSGTAIHGTVVIVPTRNYDFVGSRQTNKRFAGSRQTRRTFTGSVNPQ